MSYTFCNAFIMFAHRWYIVEIVDNGWNILKYLELVCFDFEPLNISVNLWESVKSPNILFFRCDTVRTAMTISGHMSKYMQMFAKTLQLFEHRWTYTQISDRYTVKTQKSRLVRCSVRIQYAVPYVRTKQLAD